MFFMVTSPRLSDVAFGQTFGLFGKIDARLWPVWPESVFLRILDPMPAAIHLIVPEGNWRQTSKVRRRKPQFHPIPTLQIQPQRQSLYRIRAARTEHGLATLEAMAHALGVLEGAEVADKLFAVVGLLAERTLMARGKQ